MLQVKVPVKMEGAVMCMARPSGNGVAGMDGQRDERWLQQEFTGDVKAEEPLQGHRAGPAQGMGSGPGAAHGADAPEPSGQPQASQAAAPAATANGMTPPSPAQTSGGPSGSGMGQPALRGEPGAPLEDLLQRNRRKHVAWWQMNACHHMPGAQAGYNSRRRNVKNDMASLSVFWGEGKGGGGAGAGRETNQVLLLCPDPSEIICPGVSRTRQ